MDTYDVCIIGAGVVGCALARELGLRYGARPIRIVVLEQHGSPGEETSGRNSGVLHSGIHEHPRSLKGRLAREGSALAISYALQHGIPLLKTGMVIAISWDDVRRGLWRDVTMLQRLWVNAWKTKTRVFFVTPKGLRAWEPHLTSCCGIVIPSVCVIDSAALVGSLRADAEASGTRFVFNHRVTRIDEDAGTYMITTDRNMIRASYLINAAGLYADDVASLALGHNKYVIRPLRGEYYEVVAPEKKRLIGRLVYPALPSRATGKGIHLSPRPNGQLFIGPNELVVEDKTDYTSRKTPAGTFIEAVHTFFPTLEERDLCWAYSGIRPCVLTRDRHRSDFIVSVDRDTPPLINLIGIDSPGLSAALALARHVVNLPCLQKLVR